jgi:glycine/sarcosine N-methyltransferase
MSPKIHFNATRTTCLQFFVCRDRRRFIREELPQTAGGNDMQSLPTDQDYGDDPLAVRDFGVASADGNPVMLAKAFENAHSQGHILRTIHADWRWLNRGVRDLYDAVICFGNSFTHLHDDNDRMLAGLGHWVDAGNNGYLAWGMLHFRKPA